MDDWEVILTKWKELTTPPSAVKSLNIQNVGIDYKNGEKLAMLVTLDKGAYLPERAHEQDAGYDLRTPEAFKLAGLSGKTIDTGVHVMIPSGYVGFLKSKSGLNVKHSITGEGVIDAGYTGSIKVKLYNHSEADYTFAAGDKIIQLVLLPVFTPDLKQVDKLDDTERGENGFGSTGR